MSTTTEGSELHILWLTAGLGCDGDSVSMTAARQPSIEDIVCGYIPGIPKVHLHHPLLSPQNGDEFVENFRRAARGELGPYIFILEGSIPDETTLTEGCWAGFGIDEAGQPIPTTRWIDELAPKAWCVVGAGTCAALFEENGSETFRGIDIMRTVRSFDPCLPCGVHLYDGHGKVLEERYIPTWGTRSLDEGHGPK